MRLPILLIMSFILSSSITQAQANCNESPPDGMKPIAAYSLFSSNYKSGDYAFALKYGRWIACAKPQTIEGYDRFNLATQYEKLITIYEEVGRSKQDPAVKSAYLDTALVLLNESLEMFGQDDPSTRFDIIFRKGRFFQKNYDFIEDGLAKAYDSYQRMFELNPERATKLGQGYYLKILLPNLVTKGEKENAQKIIDITTPYATGELETFLKEQQEKILGSPEERIEYYGKLVKEEPENLDALKALAKAYESTGNRAEVTKVRRKIHEIQPTYESALALAEIEQSNANYTAAARYYKQALEKAKTTEQKEKLNLSLADVHISQEKLQEAKGYVQQAIKLDPKYGSAYIKMATIYAQAISKCSDGRKLEAKDKVVYWVVLDYLNKAKEVDPSVTNTVNSQVGSYEAVTPTTEDIFFTLDYQKGQKVKVDGSLLPCYSWINETTTVR